LGLLLEQQVVSQAKAAGGEQVGPVAVIGKGPWLADQPVDDVAIVDLVLALTPQARQLLHLLLGVPDLEPLGIEAGLDPFADEPTGDGVDVADHVDGAAAVHPHLQPLARLQAASGQGPQQGQFFGQTGSSTGIGLLEQLPQECLVSVPAGEVSAAP